MKSLHITQNILAWIWMLYFNGRSILGKKVIEFRKMYWIIETSHYFYPYKIKYFWTRCCNQCGNDTCSSGAVCCQPMCCIEHIQIFQNEVLRCIVDTPWLLRNRDIHKYLNIPIVKDKIMRTTRRREAWLSYTNTEAQQLVNEVLLWRLKRKKPWWVGVASVKAELCTV